MRASRLLVLIATVLFVAYAIVYVPRLANPLWSDGQFSGWVAPFSHALLQGKRLYHDITMPIPAGSFALLAALQWGLGRYLLVDELWVCSICHLLLALVGYFIVRPFTTRWHSALVVLLTIPLLVEQPKEIAYDHTALLFGWMTVALLGAGLVSTSAKKRERLLAGAGACSMLDMAFKTSSGTGAVVGLAAALLLLTLVTYRKKGASAKAELVRCWKAVAVGMLAGVAVHALLVLAVGGDFAEYLRVVFVEGPRLKSGSLRLILDLISYTVFQTPVHLSLFLGAVLVLGLFRALGKPEPLCVAAEPENDDSFESSPAGRNAALGVGALAAVLFAFALSLLGARAPGAPALVRGIAIYGFNLAHVTLLVLVVFSIGSARRVQALPDRRLAFVAVVAAAGCISLFQNLSWPILLPILHNNPIIPLALACTLELCCQASAPRLRYVVVGLLLFCLFGDKFQRYALATIPVEDPGFWKGLQINPGGKIVLDMALRARTLAGDNGTVLMLPEDPMVEALIGRPRPDLRGAVVFVDQYPNRVLAEDLRTLQNNPPQVVIVHPREKEVWTSFYQTWSRNSPAAALQNQFVNDQWTESYSLDSSYDTFFLFRGAPTHMDLYVRGTQGN